MRITDCRRDPVGQNTAVELSRSNQRALAMHVAIDKAGNGKTPLGIDLLQAAVAVEGSNDDGSANCDVARLNLTGYQIQDAGVSYHQVGGQPAEGLIDLSLQNISHEWITLPFPIAARRVGLVPYYRASILRRVGQYSRRRRKVCL